MSDRRRGLIDTSVIIDLESVDSSNLPEEIAIAAISLAELSVGPHAAKDPAERARRQERLQRVEAGFAVVPFGAEAARAYGTIYAAVRAEGRGVRGRLFDLLIAATARAAQLPLYTRNAADFDALSEHVSVIPV